MIIKNGYKMKSGKVTLQVDGEIDKLKLQFLNLVLLYIGAVIDGEKLITIEAYLKLIFTLNEMAKFEFPESEYLERRKFKDISKNVIKFENFKKDFNEHIGKIEIEMLNGIQK